MQDDAVFVLSYLCRDLEQLENDGVGLSRGKFGMLECFSAQLLVQHIGCTVQDQAHAIGEKGGARSSVGSQIALHLLDEVLRLPAGAVQIAVNGLRVRQIHGGDNKARIVSQRHHLRLEDHPARFVP